MNTPRHSQCSVMSACNDEDPLAQRACMPGVRSSYAHFCRPKRRVISLSTSLGGKSVGASQLMSQFGVMI